MTNICTYSFAPAGHVFAGRTCLAWPSNYKTLARNGFREWEKHADVLNVEVPFDGVSGYNPSWPRSGTKLHLVDDIAGSVVGNEMSWVTSPGRRFHGGINIEKPFLDTATATHRQHLLTHEIGHGVGGDNPDTGIVGTLMEGIVNNTLTPNASEKAAVVAMHGAAVSFTNKLNAGKPLGDIYSLYRGIVNTNPDASGLAWWSDALKGGTQTLAALATALGATSSAATSTFVTNLYNRCLGRAPTSTETAYWTTQTGVQAAVGIATSTEAVTYRKATRTTFWLT